MNLDFCPNKASKEFKEMSSVFGEDKAYFLWMRNNGNHLEKAPNGADSKLFQTLLNEFNGDRKEALKAKAKVYRNEFINWFGDWINDSVNASKVVDENGEPLISWHTGAGNISTFATEILDEDGIPTGIPNAIYTSSSKFVSQTYDELFVEGLLNDGSDDGPGRDKYQYYYNIMFNRFPNRGKRGFDDYLDNFINKHQDLTREQIADLYARDLGYTPLPKKQTYPLFADMKNPFVVDAKNKRWNEIVVGNRVMSTRDLEYEIRMSQYDGVIIKNVIDLTIDAYAPSTIYISFQSKKLKSATDNNGQFSKTNNNIRDKHPYVIPNISLKEVQSEEDTLSQSEQLPYNTSQESKTAFLKKNVKKLLKNTDFKFKRTNSELYVIMSAKNLALKDHYTFEELKQFAESVIIKAGGNIDDFNISPSQFDSQSIMISGKRTLNISKKTYQSPKTTVNELYSQHDLMASTPTQQQMDDEYNKISEKIRDLFQTLYKKFDKMPNKSTTRRNTQTNIFKTISELKSQQADLAITTALRSAIEQLGLMDDQDASPQSQNTLYAWFVNQEGKQIPYENVTPEQLQDIYKHQIGFYRSMLALIPNRESTLLNENQRQLRSAVESQLNVIENMWKHAVELIGEREIDKMIDKFTGLAIPQEQKENMKKVYRDWLHKNWFYGDITSFTSLFTSYGQSSNPIVRIAFHLTQYAEQKTQEELLEEAVPLAKQFQKISTLSSWVKPGWQKIFQEKNRDGVPTGYWVRPINYGQYEQDKNEFVQKLNDEFDNKYGFHYIDDDLGMVKNSVTGVYIEDDANEQWNGNTPPPYIEYMLKLIKWKCDHANMRYTYEYYSERLSRPYDPVHYPQGHGLSLKALNAYNAVQSRINYYLDLCRDKDGVSRPELPKDMGGLTDAERQELDKAKQDLEELSSPFEENGTVKVDDDYQIAMEIQTWQNFINNEVDNDRIDYSQFKLAEDEAIRLSNEKNDPSILVNFYRYNTVTKIDPSFIKAIFGISRNQSSADIIVKQILTKCMENLTKIKDNVYTRDIEPFVNNTQFWVSYQKMVQDAKDGAVYDRIEDPTLDLNNVASYYNIVYKDGNGVMYDIWGNPATSSTPSNHLMTWYGFIINKYKEIADNNNGIIPGVEDEYGNPIIFSGTDSQVYDAIKNKLFSYEATWFDKKGMMHSEIKPLPIFQILIPNDRSLITRVPVGKWSIKDSRFTNHDFDNNQGISEQPKALDDAGNSLYDNSEAYRKVTENKEVYKLYNMMIDSMKRMQKVMGFSNRTFNYQMPMLNADTSALLSRGDLNSLLYSVLNVQNDDTDMRNIKEGIRNADGTVSFDIPLRLLQKLDNMKMLSSDVIQSVILYAQMAYNYRNKKAIQDTMQTIHDNLTSSVRKRTLTDAERFGSTPVDQSPAIDDSESLKQYEAMMDSTMYGMDTGASQKVHKEASKAQVAGRKFGSSAIRTEAVATLGLNILSMFAGGFDSMAKQLRESIMNRYMSFTDLAKSYIYCLTNLPIVLANVGNPIPNCKIVAMMQLNSLSKNYTAIFDNMNHNRLVKLSNNLLMGGFSMFDYFANMVLLRAHYRNVRFYDGNVIPKGFYTAYEMRQAFKQAGKSWKEGALAHSLCKTSLWSAYEFRDGRAVVKDEWKNYVTDTVKTNIRTKSLQRSALYNGMAPDNDRARYLKTVWGKIIAAMRNWFQMVQQRNWVGSDDTSVLEVTDQITKNINFGKTKIKTSKRVSQRTDEQSSQRMGWNFETNTPQEEIVKATIRALWKTLRIGWNAFRLKFSQVKNIKLSQVERYAVRGFIMNLAMIAMLASVFIPIMNRAKQVVMPSNREEAGVTHTIQNINNGDLISLWSADATIRAFESAYAEMDPMEVKNMVKSVSALMGAVDNQTSLVQAVPEALGYSDHTLEEAISSAGKYKYYTRGERYAYKSVGPVNNIITAFTIQGAKYNLQYYTNNYGDFFRMYGYDFKSQKKDKKSNSGIQRPKIERPSIQRPQIQRPKIQRP